MTNPHTRRIGNKDGEIVFGHLDKNGDEAAVLIRGGDTTSSSEHYIQLNTKGPIKGGTTNRSPGTYQILCAEDPTDGVGFVLKATNGDIVIKAENGRIRMEAENIDLIASGSDNQNGYINLRANEKVSIKSKNVEINTSSYTKIISSGILDLTGKTILNIYGGLIQATDGVML